ncbi:MAG TPA: zinc-ribbon domain-containing protein [Pyrinomonadaceae bacterium]|jgi:predicted amidophosphoribosyltransferase|nr:zinc-ribbon domain-containing protein [Pyrinomonadaceae bacterium]
MYCPNCGTKTSANQNFCRACGLGLEKIALSKPVSSCAIDLLQDVDIIIKHGRRWK